MTSPVKSHQNTPGGTNFVSHQHRLNEPWHHSSKAVWHLTDPETVELFAAARHVEGVPLPGETRGGRRPHRPGAASDDERLGFDGAGSGLPRQPTGAKFLWDH